MENPWIVAVATVVIIALSAFFVAVEFALIAAKRHRLEDAASSSRSARAALRSSTELTLLLAGSQLGITVCTLALGAITKPAVHHWLTPLFEAWGLAYWVADVAGFVLALVIVTFLHLVVGEMAPKSWAIAHPERSATVLALPMRAFMWGTRPLLRALNGSANWILERFGVEAVNEVATGQNPDDLRHLVEHSANVGALDASFSSQLSGALDLENLRILDLLDGVPVTQVEPDATVADVRAATQQSGHLRILVGSGTSTQGLVHVRDTLLHDDATPVTELVRPVFTVDPETKVYEALAQMRETATHLAVVSDRGRTVGVVTLADVLQLLLPQTKGRVSSPEAAS
ncbi:hemolysin family protein [Ornithinimicrobium sp. F0845]|uniref:hemolysin family protein n=1 Tax=Ornithinimicrobium sp. F0845 TaxID=2926412 RepID=UPI001FF1EB1D|nr:hemolysin family protein [Ornithinimicrobium sp. F0845]MCK0112974.1 hemolysin family protein [Ornithinimicrobium sp. F0845]